MSATVLAGALGCGWSAYGSWLKAGTGVHWHAILYNASLRGVLARIVDDSVGNPLWIGLNLAVLGFTVWRLLRCDFDADGDLSVAFLTSLLISPLGWVYYLPVALGPLLAHLRGPKPRPWALLALATLLWPPGVGWPPRALALLRTPRNAVVGSLYAVGLVTLWWLSLQRCLPRSGTSTSAVGPAHPA